MIYLNKLLLLFIIGIMILYLVKQNQKKNWIYIIAVIIFWNVGGIAGVLISQHSNSNLVGWLSKLIGSIAGSSIVIFNLIKNNNKSTEEPKEITKSAIIKYTTFTYTIALLQFAIISITFMMVMSVVRLSGAARAQDVMALVPMIVICPLLSVIAALILANLKKFNNTTKIFNKLTIINRLSIFYPIGLFVIYVAMIVTIHPVNNQNISLQSDKPSMHFNQSTNNDKVETHAEIRIDQLKRPKDILAMASKEQKKGDNQQAIALYEKLISISPNMNKINYLELSSLYNQQKQYAMAETTLRRALQYYTGDAVILTGLGGTLLVKGDTDGAIDILKQACQKAPDQADSLYNLACAYARKGDTLEARSTLEKAMGKSSDVKFWALNNPDLKPLMSKSLSPKD